MPVFEKLQADGYEEVIYCQDRESGLRAIIAIHSTVLGPALGGVRMREYHSEDEAVEDALRLAKGMTYKNGVSGLPLGGGRRLREMRRGDLLHEMGIVYAPDYVINAGGVINIADELEGYDRRRAYRSIEQIYDRLQEIPEKRVGSMGNPN